jgi:hypothetical protein
MISPLANRDFQAEIDLTQAARGSQAKQEPDNRGIASANALAYVLSYVFLSIPYMSIYV